MNLVFDKWIPVVGGDGSFSQASLMEVFSSDSNIADLVVRPHERIALMRLFICIASAALDGPESIWDFDGVEEGLPKKASQYLRKWSDCFNLYDEKRPFLQFSNIKLFESSKKKVDYDSVESAKTSVSKLNFSFASGNNSSLFDHASASASKRFFEEADLALWLIAFQNFHPAGKIGWLCWGGRFNWKEKIDKKGALCTASKPDSASHSICAPSSMLHTFIRKSNLLSTIAANMLAKDTINDHYFGGEAWGRPVWEVMPSGPGDVVAINNASSTYLGRLVPICRLIRLMPDRLTMLLGDGLTYPSFNDKNAKFSSEPSATVLASRDGENVLLGADLDKAIWRELHALVVKKVNGGTGGALALSRLPDHQSHDLWVGAFVTDKATILDTMESVFHLPGAMQENSGLDAYRSEVDFAEDMGRKLGWAIEVHRQQSDGGWQNRLSKAKQKNELLGQLKSKAMTFYWTSVEKRRDLLMAYVEACVLDPESAQVGKSSWRAAVEKTAADAYRLACGSQTARQLRAFALGQEKLKSANNGGIHENAVKISEVSE